MTMEELHQKSLMNFSSSGSDLSEEIQEVMIYERFQTAI